MNIRKLMGSMVAMLGMAAVVVPAHAQYVTLSDSGTITGTQTAYLSSSTAGSAPSGTLATWVVSGDSGNAAGGLTFVFQLSQTSNPDHFVELDTLGYSGYSTQLSYADNLNLVGGTAGVAGNSATYQGQLSATGPKIADDASFIGFSLSSGQSTKYLVVRTNALGYQSNQNTAYNGGGHSASSYTAFGATAPEPTTVAAFGFVGLGVVALAFRARRGKVQMAA